jgi:hypothetical protein
MTKPIGKKKSPPRGSSGSTMGGAKGKDITFHLRATSPGELSSIGAPPSGKPSASSDVASSVSPKSKRRQRKKKKQQASVDPILESSSQRPCRSRSCGERRLQKVMDTGDDGVASTTSASSNRTYATGSGIHPSQRLKRQTRYQCGQRRYLSGTV